MLLLRSSLALPFWAGVIACGIIIPLAISVSSLFAGEVASPLLITAIILHTVGTFALKYCLLKAGIYNPILPVAMSTYH
jgi:formate-dependent nitrite reductase membrane component NrfD